MSVLRLLLIGLLVAGVVGVKADENQAKDNREKIVGLWEAVKADKGTLPVGSTVEFSRDGKVKLTRKKAGKEQVKEHKYQVVGEKLIGTNEHGEKQSLTIKKLTATELIVQDEDKTVEFKRKK